MTPASSNPRRHPHVAAAIDYVRHLGGDDVDVVGRKNNIVLVWICGDARMQLALSRAKSSPEIQSSIAKQRVRQVFRAAGIEVRA